MLFLITTFLFVPAIIFLILFLFQILQPVNTVEYQYAGSARKTASLPLVVPTESEKLHVHVALQLPAVHPSNFILKPDDCITSMIVNGQTIPQDLSNFCHAHPGRKINLQPYLHPGNNVIEWVLRDTGGTGGMWFPVAWSDPLVLTLTLSIFGLLAWYGIIFFAYVFPNAQQIKWLYLILLSSFFLHLAFTWHTGYGYDVTLHKKWSRSAVMLGVNESYVSQVGTVMLPNYPPLTLMIFTGVGHAYKYFISPAFDISTFALHVLIKMPAIFADILIAFILYLLCKHIFSPRAGLIAAAAFAFHPAAIYDSAVWGQTDAIATLMVCAVLYAIHRKWWFWTGLLAICALMVKLQALIALPVIAAMMLIIKQRASLHIVLGSALGTVLIFLPFLPHERYLDIIRVIRNSMGYYPSVTMGAYNLWFLLFGPKVNMSDRVRIFGIQYRTIGLLLFLFVVMYILKILWQPLVRSVKTKQYAFAPFFATALISCAFFLLNTEMHERYLFPFIALGVPLLFLNLTTAILYCCISLLFLANLMGVLSFHDIDKNIFASLPILRTLIAYANIYAFILLLLALRDWSIKSTKRSKCHFWRTWGKRLRKMRCRTLHIAKNFHGNNTYFKECMQRILITKRTYPQFMVGIIFLGLATIPCILLLTYSIQPKFKANTVTFEQQETAYEYPFFLKEAHRGIYDVRFTLTTSILYPTKYHFKADDCITMLWINGVPVKNITYPLCNAAQTNILQIEDYMRKGDNTIRVMLDNHGGPTGVVMHPALTDRNILLCQLLLILFILFYFFLFYRHVTHRWRIITIACVGIALRLFYFTYTPYAVRAHDVGGHLEYIRYVAEHWLIPPSHGGFQFYQPPLYYFFSAAIYRVGQVICDDPLLLIQIVSLLVSALSLAIAFFIGSLLFDKKSQQTSMQLYCWAIATLPGLIFFATRINNDVFFQLFSFAAIASILYWWKKRGGIRSWIIFSAILALGMCAKTNMVIFYPVALISLLLAQKMQWKKKLMLFLILIGIYALVCGSITFTKFSTETDYRFLVIGNRDKMSGELQKSVVDYFVFNPFKVLAHPFTDVFGFTTRRQYLWEYFYRTMFFGEFIYDDFLAPIARGILLISFFFCIIIPKNMIGDLRKLRTSPFLPLWLTILFSFVAFVFLRFFIANFSCSGDFRYAVHLVIPFAFYAFKNLHKEKPWLAKTIISSGWLLIALFILFILYIPAKALFF